MNNFIVHLILPLMLMSCVSARYKNGTIYKTDQNKELIDSMYNKRIEKWAQPHQIIDIHTSYGRTNIIVSGRGGNTPLFLINAMGMTATMWFPNIQELSKSFRVYSINTIGDLGKSEDRLDKLVNHPKNGEQYADWLNEICDSLNIKTVNVVGSSMGGWIALNFAVYQSEKVKKLVLLGPMGLKANYLKVMGKLFKVILNPTDKNKKNLISFALGNDETVISEMYDYMMIATNCQQKIAPPKGLKKEELKRIKSKTILVLGTKDECIGNSIRNETFAKKYISDLSVITISSGHLINVEQPEFVNELIKEVILE